MSESIICEDCGTKAAAHAMACPSCGLKLNEVDAGSAFPLPPEEAHGGEVEASHNTSGVTYASNASRFTAALIDTGIMLGIKRITTELLLTDIVTNALIGFFGEFGSIRMATRIYMCMSIMIPLLYYAVFESSKKQATIGKRIVGIKVIGLTGQPVSFWRSCGRSLSRIVSLLICGIGFLVIPLNEKKQGLHDMLASTLVVRK